MPLIAGNWLSEAQQSNESTLGWEVNANATVTLSSLYAYDGGQSLELTATNTLAPQARTVDPLQQTTHGWTSGQTYTMSAYVRSPAGATNVRFLVNHRDSGGVSTGQFNQVVGQSSATGFVKLEATITVPAGTTELEPILFFNGSTSGTKHYADQIFVGVASVNELHVVDAGEAQYVAAGDIIQLQGSVDDPENGTMDYQWSIAPDYTGPTVSIQNATSLQASCEAPFDVYGVDVPFVLNVTDALGRAVSDEVVVIVQPCPFRVVRIGSAWQRCRLHQL